MSRVTRIHWILSAVLFAFLVSNVSAQTLVLQTTIKYAGTPKVPQVLITFPSAPQIKKTTSYRLDRRVGSSAKTIRFTSQITKYTDTAVQPGQRISYALAYVSTSGIKVTAKATVSIPAQGPQPTPTPTATPTPTLTPIMLPRELFFNKPTDQVQFVLPQSVAVDQIQILKLRIHNIDGEDRAEVQINNSAPISLNNNTVTIKGLGESYEGTSKLEFPVDTKDLEIAIPAGVVLQGKNTLSFKYNGPQQTGIHRFSMGYRVLKINLLDSQNNEVIPSSTFVDEDPALWTVSTTPADIAAGKLLWSTAQLFSNPTSSTTLKAKCSDCHMDSGADLKYFNYSPRSIAARAQFHQLTATQGYQIAAYIRSINVPAPGRPWNPPYQPGPGLDQQPVQNWAAGAGLDAVLAHDNDLVGHLFPSGQISSSDIALTKKINMRELPAMQLLSWNSWLPKIHPMDAPMFAPGELDSSAFMARYNFIKTGLGTPGTASADTFIRKQLTLSLGRWLSSESPALFSPHWCSGSCWGEEEALQYYSVGLFRLVKIFGWMQDYNIEGRIQDFVGPTAEIRGWNSAAAFTTTPAHISRTDSGRFLLSHEFGSYLGSAWYYLQLILNPGNGQWSDNYPLDGMYIQLIRNELDRNVAMPQALQSYAMVTRMMQERANSHGLNSHTGFNVVWGQDLTQEFISGTESHNWRQVSQPQFNALMDALTESWLNFVGKFTYADFEAEGYTVPGEMPNRAYFGSFLERLRYFIVFMNHSNPTSQIKNNLVQWAHKQWPIVRFDLVGAGISPVGINGGTPNNNLKFAVGAPILIQGSYSGPADLSTAWLDIDGVSQPSYNYAAYKAGFTFSLGTPGIHTVRICGYSVDRIPSCKTLKLNIS